MEPYTRIWIVSQCSFRLMNYLRNNDICVWVSSQKIIIYFCLYFNVGILYWVWASWASSNLLAGCAGIRKSSANSFRIPRPCDITSEAVFSDDISYFDGNIVILSETNMTIGFGAFVWHAYNINAKLFTSVTFSQLNRWTDFDQIYYRHSLKP